MNSYRARPLRARVVVDGRGHVNHGRVDVRQAVKNESRLVGDHGSVARPRDRQGQVVELGPGQDWYPVHTAGDVLEAPAPRQESQLSRIDSGLTSLKSGHVAVMIRSGLDQSVEDRHLHVPNRISEIRLGTFESWQTG